MAGPLAAADPSGSRIAIDRIPAIVVESIRDNAINFPRLAGPGGTFLKLGLAA
jgi:hypothetical protein